MVDIVITPALCVGVDTSSRKTGSAGAAITAGQVVYLDPVTNKWLLADADSATAAANRATGIALNGAALNQPVAVQTAGDITVGGTLVAGSAYYLSKTAGGICPVADLTTGAHVCQLGLAKSTTVLTIGIQFPGVTL